MGVGVKKVGGGVTYVIGSHASGPSIVYAVVDTIGDRNALDKSQVPMCLVRKAAGGDPTVHRGWAMYAVVDDKWVKISEEESVDGVWGVKAEILATVMSKLDAVNMEKRLQKYIEDHVTFVPSHEAIAEIGSVWDEETIVSRLNSVIITLNKINQAPGYVTK